MTEAEAPFPVLSRFARRWVWVFSAASFLAGWLSFALVERGESMARIIAALVLIGWPWVVLEPWLSRALTRASKGRLSENLLRFVTQALQQEILFFALAFLVRATRADVGQVLFTTLAVAAATVASFDPWYHKRVAADPVLNHGFHALCSFFATLVVLPIALRLPLETALPLALLIAGAPPLISLPAWMRGADRRMAWRHLAVFVAVLAVVWFGRRHIPPAGLWVRQALITAGVSDDLQPGPAVDDLSAETLRARGVDAFIAVHAPQGLRQDLQFEWRHEGEVLDRIPAEIRGGREAGYRTFSRKQNFPEDPRGAWSVDVRTPHGQLIARLKFAVL